MKITFNILILISILAASHIIVFKSTQQYDERAAVIQGFGYYDNLLDFQWKTKEEIYKNIQEKNNFNNIANELIKRNERNKEKIRNNEIELNNKRFW